jgi:hypothetical protein
MRYNSDLLRHLLQVALRRKWSFIILMLLGGIGAMVFVYFQVPKASASATFFADANIVPQQVERLNSRDLLLEAVRESDYIKTEYYRKGWLGRKTNLYRESPVLVYLQSFPDHLREVEIQLSFQSKGQFELSFEALGEKVNATGRQSQLLRVGSIEIVVQPTKFWSKRYEGEKVYFRVRDENKVAAEIASRFKVWNYKQSINRIVIEIQDATGPRALDVLQSVTRQILEEFANRRRKELDRQLSGMRARMESMLRNLNQASGLNEFLNSGELEEPNESISQNVIRLDAIMARREQYFRRDSLLRDLKSRSFVADGFAEVFRGESHLPEDSPLLARIQMREDALENGTDLPDAAKFREMNLAIHEAWNLVRSQDSIRFAGLEKERKEVEYALMNDLSIRDAYIREAIRRREDGLVGILNWEEYLQLAEKSHEAEFETLVKYPVFELMEKPVLSFPNRRVSQIVRLISGVLLGGIIALFLSIVAAFGGGNISSHEHLNLLTSNQVKASLRNVKEIAQLVRHVLVAVEMEREEHDKVISLVVTHFAEHHQQFCRELAARYTLTGRKVLIRNDNLPAEDDATQDPLEIAAQLLSSARQKELQEASREYDIVLQFLPPLNQHPEAWYQVRPYRDLIYVAVRGKTSQAQIRDMEALSAAANIRVQLVFDAV